MHKLVKMTLILLLFMILIGCQTNKTESQEAAKTPIQEKAVETVKSDQIFTGEWVTDYKKALTIAQDTKRPILINFTGSDWCIWCQRLSKEVFTDKSFIEFAGNNLVLLTLDFPQNIKQTDEVKKQNEELRMMYKVDGFPTIVILSPEGKEINRTGYKEGGAENYIKMLKEMISQ